MAIRNIRRQATNPLAAAAQPNVCPIYCDSDDNIIKVIPAGSGTTEVQIIDASSTQTLTNKTLTSPSIKSSVVASTSAAVTLTAAQSGGTFLMDRASGTSYTLPAPVVGLEFYFINSVLQTTGANVVVTDAGTTLVTGSIVMFSGENVTPSATLGPKQFAGNGSSHIKVTTNGTTTGGGIGTILQVLCISSTLWYVTGVVNSPSGSLATPFST